MNESVLTPEFVYGQLRLVALSVLTLAFVVFLQGNGIARLQKRTGHFADTVGRRLGDVEQWAIDHTWTPEPVARAARPARKTTAAKAAADA